MAVFPTTRWSLIRASDQPNGDMAAAWSGLVRDYRPAILGFFRRGPLAREAEDLAQEFLLRSMRDGWWARADPEVGSFRCFLLVLLKRFLSTQRQSGHRRFEMNSVAIEETASENSPESQFDLDFALCLTGIALAELRAEYASDDRGELFDALQPWLSEAPERGELVALGAKLGIPANTLAVQLKRLRLRFRKAVWATLAEVCVDAEHTSAEFVALHAVLASDGAN